MRTLFAFLASALLCFGQAEYSSLVLLGNPATTNVQDVDTFIDFHLENTSGQLSPEFYASAYSHTDWWSMGTQTAGVTNSARFTNVIGTDVMLATPLRTPDGVTHTSTGTHWIRDDLAVSGDWLRLVFLFRDANATLVESECYYIVSGVTNSGSLNNRDLFAFYDNPYAVSQHSWEVGEGVSPRSGMHSSLSGSPGPSIVSSLPVNTVIRVNILVDYNSGIAYLSYHSGSTLLFNSIMYGTYPIASTQGFWIRYAGYIYGAGIAGYIDSTAFSINYSAVNTNRAPWIPPVPSAVVAHQSGDGAAIITWTDNSLGLNFHSVDQYHGSWTDGVTNSPVGTNSVLITGLTAGETYKWRVYSTFVPSGAESTKVETGSITITNLPTPVWTDSMAGAGTTASDSNPARWRQPVTCGTSGSCDKLRVWCRTSSGTPGSLKMALYDSANNLLGSGTTSSVTPASGSWVEVTLGAPVNVTASTSYKIGMAAASAAIQFGYQTASGSMYVDFNSYASFPDDPWSGVDNVPWTMACGMEVIP